MRAIAQSFVRGLFRLSLCHMQACGALTIFIQLVGETHCEYQYVSC